MKNYYIPTFEQFINESVVNEGTKTKDFEKLIKPFKDLKLTPESTRTAEFKNGLMQQLHVSKPSELSYIKINLGNISIEDHDSAGDFDSAPDVVAMFLEAQEEELIPTAVWWDPKAKFVNIGADEDDLEEEDDDDDDDPRAAAAAKKRKKEYDAAENWHNKNFYNSIKVYHDTIIDDLEYVISYTEDKVKSGDRIIIFSTKKTKKMIEAFKQLLY